MLDGRPIGQDRVVDIPASGTVEIESGVGIEEEGRHDVAVVVDPEHTIRDGNRENNIREAMVTVRGPSVPDEESEPTRVPPGKMTKGLQIGALPPPEATYSSGEPDLICVVPTTNGAYLDSGTSVAVTVTNNGTLPAWGGLLVGVCLEKDAQLSQNLKDWSGQVNWIGKQTVTWTLAPTQSALVNVTWQGLS